MPKYYAIKEDAVGGYVNSNHVRYNVTIIDPERVHIPAGREGDMTLYDTIEEFLSSVGLGPVVDHAFPEPVAEPVYVPESVPAWAVKAQLELDGDIAVVEEYISTMDGAQGVIARHAYKGNFFLRTSPSVALIQSLLGKTDEEVDALFISADKLTA